MAPQTGFRKRRRALGEIPDTLLLVEHPSVYTLGSSSKSRTPAGLPHPLHVVERGVDITYHGPGQFVGQINSGEARP